MISPDMIKQLEEQGQKLINAANVLRELSSNGNGTRAAALSKGTDRPKRFVSAAARRRMAQAQKRRWAGIKRQKKLAGV
jgi:hypothetical protein